MSYKAMWRTLLLKMRYGFKSYILYFAVTLFFIVIYYIALFNSDAEEIYEMSSLCVIAFLYIPVSINLAIQTIEYSKCYYLVPRTMKERKRFIIFGNVVKMIVSFILDTIVLVTSLMIRPEIKANLVFTYIVAGLTFTVALGCNGYGIYRKDKKQKSYKLFMTQYVITIILVWAVFAGILFFIDEPDSFVGRCGSFIVLAAAAVYHIYSLIRFKKLDAVYEKIDRNERRIMTRMGSRIM